MPEKPISPANKLNAKTILSTALTAEVLGAHPELREWLNNLGEESGENQENAINIPTAEWEIEALILSLIKSVGTGAKNPTWFRWRGILATYFTGNLEIVEPNLDISNMTPEEIEANEDLLRQADTLRGQFEYTVKP